MNMSDVRTLSFEQRYTQGWLRQHWLHNACTIQKKMSSLVREGQKGLLVSWGRSEVHMTSAQPFNFGQHYAPANRRFVWLRYAYTTQSQKVSLVERGN